MEPVGSPHILPGETPDEAFRREMRGFMQHVNGELKDLKHAVDWLIKAMEEDERRHEGNDEKA